MWSTSTSVSLAWPHLLTYTLSNQRSNAGTKWLHCRIRRVPASSLPANFVTPWTLVLSKLFVYPGSVNAAAPSPALRKRSRLVRSPFTSFSVSRFRPSCSAIGPPFAQRGGSTERSAGESGDEAVEECVVEQGERN